MTKLKTVDIKGKAYVEVNQRIKYFRETYKDGAILTEFVTLDDGVAVMKASVWIDGVLVATGHAYEKEGSTFINKTSYIENCETSAIGRALGILGIGIDTSVASYEEVENAIKQQKQEDKLDPKQQQALAIKKELPNKLKLECSDDSIMRQATNLTLGVYGFKNWKALDFTKVTEREFLDTFIEKVKELS